MTLKSKRIVEYVSMAAMVGLCLLIITGPQVGFGKVMSEFLVHFMFSFLGLGIIFMLFDQTKLMFFSLGICGLFCVFLKNESANSLEQVVERNGPKLRVFHLNLGNINNEEELYKMISSSNADVISLQELTPDWNDLIADSLSKIYPYSFSMVRIDPFGKALYSKYHFEQKDTIFSNKNQRDILVTVDVNGNKFDVISSYLVPALDKSSLAQATIQLDSIKNKVLDSGNNHIVMGEFNMVYWAEEIRKFRQNAKLLNSRKDIFPGSFKVPYDHIFYSKGLQCVNLTDIYSESGFRCGIFGTFQKVNG